MLAIDSNKSVAENKNAILTGLLGECVYGICLRLKQHVFATHQELTVLRRCAEMLHERSSRIIYVVAAANKNKTNFIVSTLQHLGVSCGQIKVSPVSQVPGESQDIWLFVTHR